MPRILTFIIIFVICVSWSITQKDKNELDNIFKTNTFYITRTQYGGYFWVHDSITFHRDGDKITVDFIPVSPFDPGGKISRNLTDQELQDIRGLLDSKHPIFKRKCQNDFITVFNHVDTVLLMDRNCEKLIAQQIRNIIEK